MRRTPGEESAFSMSRSASSSGQPPILAYYIRTDIGPKKGNQPFHHFRVAHPSIGRILTKMLYTLASKYTSKNFACRGDKPASIVGKPCETVDALSGWEAFASRDAHIF